MFCYVIFTCPSSCLAYVYSAVRFCIRLCALVICRAVLFLFCVVLCCAVMFFVALNFPCVVLRCVALYVFAIVIVLFCDCSVLFFLDSVVVYTVCCYVLYCIVIM